MQGEPCQGYLGFISCSSSTAEGFETQLCQFYLCIPLAGVKRASRKAIFQLFPFIKVSFAKIFPSKEPKNVRLKKKCQLLYAFSHIVMQTTVVYLIKKKSID